MDQRTSDQQEDYDREVMKAAAVYFNALAERLSEGETVASRFTSDEINELIADVAGRAGVDANDLRHAIDLRHAVGAVATTED